MRPRLLLALLGLAAIAACSSDAATPVSGGACTTNNDCPAEEICIGGTCTAGSTSGCVDETDCAATEYCERATGTCKTEETVGCMTDDVCPSHQRCNTTSGVCIDGARRCVSDAQCTPIGQHCDTAAGQCKECVTAMHCPSGLICNAGACVMNMNPAGCTGDFGCTPPSTICEAGSCVAGCTANSCGAGAACNTTTGRCQPVSGGCAMDSECGAPTRVCEAPQCVPGCAEPGGIQCTGGTVCEATTGRCRAAMNTCANDGQCGPPGRVCEASQCVPGCGQAGGIQCTGNTVCDNGTGRCVAVAGPCTMDSQCGPPNTVCESGQCIPGCGQIGGVQCSGQTVCNAGTGRCDSMTPMGCTSDAQCGAPSNVCNAGSCAPGCAQTGCASGQQCNASTGRCGNGQPMPGTGLPLDAACAGNQDCASRVCFDFEGNIGARCVASCGSSSQCPSGFTCFDYNGAHMCVAASLFAGATFTSPAGAQCSGPGECQSGYCDDSAARVCREQCTEDSQCGLQSCQWQAYTPELFAGLCGPRAGVTPNGPCSVGSDCASGVCFQNSCRPLCSSSADCANGNICALFDDSVCVAGGIFTCFVWQPNIVKACAAVAHGQGGVGAPCADGTACRSGVCLAAFAQCSDTCATDADCPSAYRCKVVPNGALSDGTEIFLNVCMPEGA